VVKLSGVLVLVLSVLLAACGGSDDSSGRSTSTTRPTSTARPLNGPTAVIEPKSGPPGTQVTISGSGWPASATITIDGVSTTGQTGKAYATVRAANDGTFRSQFLLEKAANGDELQVGRYDFFVRSGASEVDLPFLVEVRRPVRVPGGPGG
jgi:hypothetical protein